MWIASLWAMEMRGTARALGRRARRVASLAAALALGTAAFAETRLLPEAGAAEWRSYTFPRIAQHTRYEALSPADLPGRRAFRSHAECSASAMILPLEGIDLAEFPRLSWRWRVRAPLEITDETAKAGDDFVARVYVMFPFEPERVGFWRRAQQAMGERIFGETMPGRALNFVWASRVTPGRRWRNPHSEEAAMIALRSGRPPTDHWVREEVDLLEEHARSFGWAPEAALALAIMTDSDAACATASAEFADFRMLPPRAAAPAKETP